MEELSVIPSATDWFTERVESVDASPAARAYVVSVLTSYVKPFPAMNVDSVVMTYAEAKKTSRFDLYQTVGDWALWSSVFRRKDEHKEVTVVLGSMSYAACHRIVLGKWDLYVELAENLHGIASSTRRAIESDCLNNVFAPRQR